MSDLHFHKTCSYANVFDLMVTKLQLEKEGIFRRKKKENCKVVFVLKEPCQRYFDVSGVTPLS